MFVAFFVATTFEQIQYTGLVHVAALCVCFPASFFLYFFRRYTLQYLELHTLHYCHHLNGPNAFGGTFICG